MIARNIRKSVQMESDKSPPIDMSFRPQETSMETSRNELVVFPEENDIGQDNDIPGGEELSTIIQEQWDSVLRDEVRENAIPMEIEGKTNPANSAMERRGDNNDNDNEEFTVDGEKKEFAKIVQQMKNKVDILQKARSTYQIRKASDSKESNQPSESSPAFRQVKKRNHNNFLKEAEVLDTRLRKRNREGQNIETRKRSTRNNNIQQITE